MSEMLTTVDDVATGEDYIMDQLEKWLPHLADADKQHAADVAEFVAHKAAAEKAAGKTIDMIFCGRNLVRGSVERSLRDLAKSRGYRFTRLMQELAQAA